MLLNKITMSKSKKLKDKIICPICGKKTKNEESGMGYIICENCRRPFRSN